MYIYYGQNNLFLSAQNSIIFSWNSAKSNIWTRQKRIWILSKITVVFFYLIPVAYHKVKYIEMYKYIAFFVSGQIHVKQALYEFHVVSSK